MSKNIIESMKLSSYQEYLKSKSQRKKPVQREEKLQIRIMNTVRIAESYWPPIGLIFHIPNGKRRNVIEAVNLKRMGVKRGVPDFFFPYPVHPYHGLWIEVKEGKGALSPEQREFMLKTKSLGYYYEIARSVSDFWDILAEYTKNNAIECIREQFKDFD